MFFKTLAKYNSVGLKTVYTAKDSNRHEDSMGKIDLPDYQKP